NEFIDNRYRVIEPLHSSKFSQIYLAEDINLGKFVVIKIFGKYFELKDNYEFLKLFTNQFKTLKHKNIVNIEDFIDSNYVFQVMEYIEGHTLEHLNDKRLLKKSQILPYLLQIAEAMQMAHAKSIYHCDLKPSNIMVNNQDIIKIIDFSHPQLHKTLYGEDILTNEYIAPEFLNNVLENTDNVQRDIYAYGITMFELVYGYLPFKTNSNQQIEYILPNKLRRSKKPIDKIIRKCIYYYPEDRYQSFDEVITDLKSIKITKEPLLHTFKKTFANTIKLKNINPDYRSDLKYLWLALMSLLLILPFYLVVQRNYEQPYNEIEIDSPPYHLYVNMLNQGQLPLKTALKKGDHLEFVDNQGNSMFEMFYNNEKKLDIEFQRKKIFVNKKLYGQTVKHVHDLPLGKNLKYLKTDIFLSKKDFKKQNNYGFIINLDEVIDEQIFSELPNKTAFINMKNNKKIKTINSLKRLKYLEGLNIENSEIITEDLKEIKPLKHLNLKKTKIKRLSPILKQTQLQNLDISDTDIEILNSIENLNSLENLFLSTNMISDFRPLYKLSNLRSISTNTQGFQESTIEEFRQFLDRSNAQKSIRHKYISKKNNNYFYFILFLVTLIMAAVIVFLFRLLFKKVKKQLNNIVADIDEAEQQEEPQKKIKAYGSRELSLIRTSIDDNRLYTPPKDNALYYLGTLLNDNDQDKELLSLKDELIGILEDKCKLHVKRDEYEAIYLISDACNQYFPNEVYSSKLKMAKKHLLKNYLIKMKKIKKGSFLMGDFTVQFSDKSLTPHIVHVESFKISDTVITNKQFCEFLNAEGNQREYGTSWYKEDSQYARIEKLHGQYICKEPYNDFPVYDINWFGAMRFCEWKGGRLPTEAEWEYAARSAGKNNLYAINGKLNKNNANYLVDINDTLWHSVFPVKSFKPNSLKLYEMSGNILEWCYDWYDKYYYDISPENNPKGPKNGEMKVVRGGAWCFGTEQMKTIYRGSAKPLTRNNFIGFRLVMPITKDKI
ncbi:MAG: SUMF1/EgtB/PvdO family nonheme iron enzyme, partial [Candidatus Cloacimonetes bacterium]|nr:SUMF1/EgtB/PvdO family nonheme iron enzyme [Candidatus Cloacimonadota bacterium]